MAARPLATSATKKLTRRMQCFLGWPINEVKKPNPATILPCYKRSHGCLGQDRQARGKNRVGPRFSAVADGNADWGHPALLVERPLARVRSGKPRPGGSHPGTPNGPFDEGCHLKSLAAITNVTVQKLRNNGKPQPGQAGAVWEFRNSLLSCPRERLPHAIPTAFPPSCWNMTTGTCTRQPLGDASP